MKKKTLLAILGNLTAFGPFVTDFYLPCLPTLTKYFAASPSIIQTSLTAGMVGLAVGQLIIGPLTDKFGRRRPLLWCLALFVAATVGCILSTAIEPFVAFRLLQGLTGAGGLVISKTIIADTVSSDKLSKYLAVLAAVQGAAPIAAPDHGGVAFSWVGWVGAFGALGLWSVALLFACRKLQETLPAERRLQMPIVKSFRCYAPVIRNGNYLIMNLLQGLASAGLMAYISASPFIFQNHFGLSPLQYSICFACNAVALVVGSSIVMKIKNLRLATSVSICSLLAASALTSVALLVEWPFAVFEVAVFAMLFGVGMITPVATTRALNAVSENKGIASALLGTVPYLLGGIVAPLTGLADIIHPTVVIIMACTVVCTILWLISLKLK